MPESSNPLKKIGQRLVSPRGDDRPLLLDLLLAIGIVAFGMALFRYAYPGIFSRFYADDFYLTGGFLASGFWKSQIGLYTSWSPRFAGTFLLNLSEFFGRLAIQAWTALVVVLWVVGPGADLGDRAGRRPGGALDHEYPEHGYLPPPSPLIVIFPFPD